MAADLITLEYAKAHVRLDHDADDVDLAAKIAGASVMIIHYLKTGANSFIDENGDLIPGETVPADVQSACAVLVGMLFKDRDGELMADWQHGYLPFEVTAQVYMRRDPALA
jgi:hypothetical protein